MFIPGEGRVIAWCCNYGMCGERIEMRRGVNPQKRLSVLPHELRLFPGSLQKASTVDMYTDVDFYINKGKMRTKPHTELLSDLLGSSVGALSSQSFTM